MKILITGSTGQLGKNLKTTLKNIPYFRNLDLKFTTRNEIDLTNLKLCKSFIDFNKPDWVINTAAYTKVDKAENEKDIAQLVNCDGPIIIAESLNKYGGKFLQLSTDFVFSGNQNVPYIEGQKTDPINFYGKTKADAEYALQRILGKRAFILRTSWLYSKNGNNFVTNILRLLKQKSIEGKNLDVVSDQIGCPTNTEDLSVVCSKIIEKSNFNIPNIMHWRDAGIASWYDFAVAIGEIGFEKRLIKALPRIIPIKSSNYNDMAVRPTYSVLSYEETSLKINLFPSHWRKSLKKIIAQINHI